MSELLPLYHHLVQGSYVLHDPGCFRRRSRQPKKSGKDRFNATFVWWVNWVRCLERIGVITVTNERTTKERPAFKGFLNIRLDDEDKARLTETDNGDVRAVLDNAATLLYQGYKLAFGYDKTSGAVQATLTCWVDGHADYGYAISSRHPDFDRALMSVLYKHFFKTNECWTDFVPPAPVQQWD